VVAPPESFNNELGHPHTALRADESTRFLVLELSARGIGHVAQLAATAPPRIGAVLNVGSAHIGEFGSVEAIATAKSELVQALPAAADGGVAILNADDPLVAAMAAVTSAAVVTVGRTAGALIRAEDVTQDGADHARFTLVTPEGSAPVALAVVGAHQVGNALTAAAAGRAVGMTTDAIAAALSTATAASRWRMEVTELADGITLINDAYNANPHSMKAALRSLSIIGRGRRCWAVLGEMAELGPETNSTHDEVGRLVVRLGIERLIVVQGPGGATGAAVGGRTGARALHLGAHLEGSWGGESVPVTDTAAAIEILDEELEQGDVVLVKASRSAGLESVALRLIADRSGAASTGATGSGIAGSPGQGDL
jgi:UDP-N-acetylmuramoyl-tripeptide--D-alanyl-D-alanine ligase